MSLLRPVFASLVLLAAVPATAAPLTVAPGESWIFRIAGGEPVRARRVPASRKPAPGEVKVTMLTALGTSLTLSSNNRVGYTFRAELLGVPATAKQAAPRTCTLPANNQPVLEYWPTKAAKVRLSRFEQAADGRC
jgi:hypothetical protein